MKIYIVTSGVYSDYTIDAVFSTREMAEKYIATNNPTDYPYTYIEEYEVDNSVLKDIMLESCEVDDKYWYTQKYSEVDMSKAVCCYLDINGHDILKRVQNPNFKCATLVACRGGNHQKKVLQDGRVRKLTPIEYMRLQGVPSWYKMNVADSHVYNMCGDGWNIKTIEWLMEGIKYAKRN